MKRWEPIAVYKVAETKTSRGTTSVQKTLLFNTGATIQDPHSSVTISEKYRLYQGLTLLVMRYNPTVYDMDNNQEDYSIVYNGTEYRLDDVRVHNDRQWATLTCYTNKPSTAV